MSMFISLGGVNLNPSMNWKDRFQSFQVAQSVNRTVGGRAIVFATPLRAGRKITFEATQESGWLSESTVQLLMGMAATVGGTFSLKVGDTTGNVESFDVIFRHNEPPALELSPIINRPLHDSTDYFIGTIKLLTV